MSHWGVLSAAALTASIALTTPGRGQGLRARDRPGRSRGGGRLERRLLAAAVAGLATALLVGGIVGFASGVVVGWGVHLGLGRLSSRADQQRERSVSAWSPLIADLLADLVAAGLPPELAIARVAEVGGHPLAESLSEVATRRAMGASPLAACASLLGSTATERVGRALARSLSDGASPVDSLRALAHEARAERRSVGEQAGKRAGAMTALPLGLTMLPAFVLVAVVPLVVSGLDGVQLSVPTP